MMTNPKQMAKDAMTPICNWERGHDPQSCGHVEQVSTPWHAPSPQTVKNIGVTGTNVNHALTHSQRQTLTGHRFYYSCKDVSIMCKMKNYFLMKCSSIYMSFQPALWLLLLNQQNRCYLISAELWPFWSTPDAFRRFCSGRWRSFPRSQRVPSRSWSSFPGWETPPRPGSGCIWSRWQGSRVHTGYRTSRRCRLGSCVCWSGECSSSPPWPSFCRGKWLSRTRHGRQCHYWNSKSSNPNEIRNLFISCIQNNVKHNKAVYKHCILNPLKAASTTATSTMS